MYTIEKILTIKKSFQEKMEHFTRVADENRGSRSYEMYATTASHYRAMIAALDAVLDILHEVDRRPIHLSMEDAAIVANVLMANRDYEAYIRIQEDISQQMLAQ